MKISENDIASVEPFGMLDGKPVNLTRTKGGLNLAVMGDQVLGAASHQAILCYSIEQRFPSFQPMLMKSEGLKLSAESHSHFLSDELRKSGHDIYSVQNGDQVSFFITRQNIRVGSILALVKGENLVVEHVEVPHEFIDSTYGAVSEKILNSGLKGLKVKNVR